MLSHDQTRHLFALAAALSAAPRGDRGKMITEEAALFGMSVQNFYKTLKETTGYGNGRKRRDDCGKSAVPRDLALTVSGMVRASRRANGKYTLSIKRACEILAKQGYGVANAETGKVGMPSPSTMSKAMRAQGCHPRQLETGKPFVRLRTLHPNHAWFADASVCVLYYLPGDKKKMALMDETRFNEKKPGNLVEIGNFRIIRYIVADHTTSCFYLWYERAKGEDAFGLIKTFINAACDRGANDPMHGVPFTLGLDMSGANKSGIVKNFFASLDVEIEYHAPGNARASGAVEVLQNIVEREFESRLRFTDIADLAALQEKADAWRMHFNARAVHTRLKMPRNNAWLRIADEQLRTVDRDVLEAVAAWGDVTRQIKPDFTISLDTRTRYGVQEYDLRALGYSGLNIRDTVSVTLNPFLAPAVTVSKVFADGEERRWTVDPIIKDQFGFPVDAPVFGKEYKTLPDTAADRAVKDIDKIAFPETAQAPGKPARAFAHIDPFADVREAPSSIRKKGRALEVGAPKAAAVPLTLPQAAKKLRAMDPDAWERDAPGCYAALSARFPQSVPQEALEELAAHLRRLQPVPVGSFITPEVMEVEQGHRNIAAGGAV